MLRKRKRNHRRKEDDMAIMQECPMCHKKQSAKNKKCFHCEINLDKQKKSRKVKYWVNYRLPGGKQKRELVHGENLSPYNIADARVFEAKRKVQKAENRILDIKKESTMTFQELSEWYLNLEKVKALSSYWLIKLSLKKFNSVFGQQKVLTIKPVDLENYQAKRAKAGKAPGTIDHEIGKTKTMILKAFDNGMVSGETLRTFKKVKKTLKKGSDVRDRILTRDEFDSLCGHSIKHIRDILTTAYFTGMRKGEILNLTWDKIDMKNRFIHLDAADTKDKEKRSIPICTELYAVLKGIIRTTYDNHVFMFRGKPVNDIRTGLVKACKKAGIIYGRFEKNGFIFHDLRHTFNTNMRKAGIQESVIMAITGHSTREMFDRYNTVDREDTQKAIDRLEGFLQSVDQTVDQNEKKAT
jgi:integrase